MIVKFSIQNFGSIKDKQTLSFEADKSIHLDDYYIIENDGLRLLKLGLLFGSNASGKTTILKALEFFKNIVLLPSVQKTETLKFEPFLFDAQTPHQNTILSIDFLQNGKRYEYEVELNRKAIVGEVLKKLSPSKQLVFRRDTDIEKQLTKISFNSRVKIDKQSVKTLEVNTLWNNTVLGGFLKTNIESEELKDVSDWFSNRLQNLIYTSTNLDDEVTSLIEKQQISKDSVISILKNADLNISDISIKREEKEMTDDLINLFVREASQPYSGSRNLKITGNITKTNIEFEHNVKDKTFKLPLNLESEGTKRYYGFAGIISLLVQNSVVFPIDELESSLHPDLFTHFLLTFLINSKESQLIATTHNREILNNKDIFRNDAIWITNKTEDCATELYSLSDFDSSVIRDTSNIFNAYKIGKLGGIPNLGDYYIDSGNEG